MFQKPSIQFTWGLLFWKCTCSCVCFFLYLICPVVVFEITKELAAMHSVTGPCMETNKCSIFCFPWTFSVWDLTGGLYKWHLIMLHSPFIETSVQLAKIRLFFLLWNHCRKMHLSPQWSFMKDRQKRMILFFFSPSGSFENIVGSG